MYGYSNLKYIVDVGNHFTGRTIEIEADTPQECFQRAGETLDQNKLEQVIQIRDDMPRFYYTNEDGFLSPRR